MSFQVLRVPRVLANLDHLRGAGAHVELELAADQVVDRDGEQRGSRRVGEQHLAGGIGHDHAVGLVHHDVGEARLFRDEGADTFLGGGGPALALDRIADGAAQPFFRELALDQVVLRALGHGFGSHGLIAQSRQNDDRDVAGAFLRGREGFETLGLAEAKVQQDHGGLEVADGLQAAGQIAVTREFELHVAGRDEHLLEQPNVARVVFDDQNAKGLHGHCVLPAAMASLRTRFFAPKL